METFLQKMKNRLILQISFCVISVFMLFVMYIVGIRALNNIRNIERDVSEKYKVAYELEYQEEEKVIRGWILKEDIQIKEISLVFNEVEGESAITVSVDQFDNPEIQKSFSEEKEYGEIGFCRKLSSKVKESVCYEIIFSISYKENDGWEKKENYSSGKYLYQKKLYSYNPLAFQEPTFIDKQMLEIVRNGELLLYSCEQDIYIYMFEEYFYYIAGKNFNFAKEGKTHISYHVYSPQIDKLPYDRQQYGFDNLDFRFEDNEIYFEQQEEYRVAKAAIPTGYPITNIYFAIYDDVSHQVIWGEYFLCR